MLKGEFIYHSTPETFAHKLLRLMSQLEIHALRQHHAGTNIHPQTIIRTQYTKKYLYNHALAMVR